MMRTPKTNNEYETKTFLDLRDLREDSNCCPFLPSTFSSSFLQLLLLILEVTETREKTTTRF